MDPGNIRRDGAQSIATYNGAESRSGWTKIPQLYENDHLNIALVLLF